jgi:hypothetical protein
MREGSQPPAEAQNGVEDTYPALLEHMITLAVKSPTARLLFKGAMDKGWVFDLQDLGGQGFLLNPDQKILSLDHFGYRPLALYKASYFKNMLLLNILRAFRAIWQQARAPKNPFAFFRPDALLMKNRAEAADNATMAVLMAWELRGEGQNDLWRALLGSDDGDMAMVFSRALEKDAGGFYDGSILARTFCQWYADPIRVSAQDSISLHGMDHALSNADAGMPARMGSAGFTPLMAEDLSCLPSGRAYLKGMGSTITHDPHFVSMNDDINEAHLFQIVYDSRVVLVGGVPFRDVRLARLIFPKVTTPVKQ